MVTGKLHPTYDEEMKATGHATIPMSLYSLASGNHKGKNIDVSASPVNVIIIYDGRYVKFSLEEMATEAVKIIDAAKGSA